MDLVIAVASLLTDRQVVDVKQGNSVFKNVPRGTFFDNLYQYFYDN